MSDDRSRIEWVRSVEFDVRNLPASVTFYEDVWGLETIARADDAVYLRGTGPEHHLLVLRQGDVARARRVTFGVAERQTVDALHAGLAGNALSKPAELSEPGGGYGFAFRDPEGREFRVVAGVARNEPGTRTDVPVKVSHVLFQSTDPAAATAFFSATPGFRLRDHAGRNYFLGCSADHHCFGFGQSDKSEVSHVAFELPTIDGLMRGVGRMKRAGLTLEWGVGKHGPGDNVFAYFFDPDGFVIEYTGEMEQVDDATYQARTPEFWDQRTSHDVWGVAGPPTDRFRFRGPRARAAQTESAAR
jgi:catechol 2,3-dioxygenase-like lactoylglutathione lyase family enzyme